MKQLLLFVCLLLTAAGLTAQTVVYVDGDATGNNDGTAWADAYVDLDSALVNAPAGASIWIADGTYTTPADRSFVILNEFTLLGGFAGGETSADAADPTANVTILSGDVAGDDSDNFDATYLENNRILTIVDTTSTGESQFTVTLDGLTFEHGAIAVEADTNDMGQFTFTTRRAGGAIRSSARVAGSRLTFRQNRASYGSAIAMYNNTTAGSTFDDINVVGNFPSRGNILYIRNSDNITFSNSNFEGLGQDEAMPNGIFSFILMTNSSITNSTFSNIHVDGGAGAAIAANVCDDILVEGCTFTGIRSRLGAVFFVNGGVLDNDTEDPTSYIARNCSFVDCDVVAGGRGAALNIWNTSSTLDSVTVSGAENNVGIGGALYMQNSAGNLTRYTTDINNSTFSDCTDNGVGGVILVLNFDSIQSTLNINDSEFTGNSSGNLSDDPSMYVRGVGGVVHYQHGATQVVGDALNITNSSFTNNLATLGAAINFIADGPVTISGSVFESNRSVGSATGGGASGTAPINPGGVISSQSLGDTRISNSIFRNNTSGGRGVSDSRGGAIRFFGFPKGPDPSKDGQSTLFLDGVEFDNNTASIGGAIYAVLTYGIDIKNSTFSNNGIAQPDNTNNLPVTNIGGAIGGLFLGTTTFIDIDSSSFTGNQVGELAGFRSGGGAIYNQALGLLADDPFELRISRLTANNSLFQNNTSDGTSSGGAILLSGGHTTVIEGSDFIENSSSGEGGAIATIDFFELDTFSDPAQLLFPASSGRISESFFGNNTTGSQGGAISTQRGIFDLTNNIFVGNQVLGEEVSGGSGGAIIFNGNSPSFDQDDSDPPVATFFNNGQLRLTANIVHNTFIDNTALLADNTVGDALALFQPGETISMDTNSMTINLLNNAFLDQDPTDEDRQISFIGVEPLTVGANSPPLPIEVQPVSDDLTINVIGGNYFNAENGAEVVLGDTDISDLDVTEDDFERFFTDPFDDDDDIFDFDLEIGEDQGASNPLIDGGVANALVPERDFFGNLRGDTPDIGAIEADFNLTSTGEPIEESGLAMAFFPNPTVDVVTVQNNDAEISKFYVIVSDLTGRVVKTNVFTDVNNRIDLSAAPAGIYNLQLIVNGKLYAKQIVKQ